MIIEFFTKKLLNINYIINDDKEKYATFRITVYTLSRFFESISEILFIGLEIYQFNNKYIDTNHISTKILYWITIVITFLFPIFFRPIVNSFVVDNEDDYDLTTAAQHE